MICFDHPHPFFSHMSHFPFFPDMSLRFFVVVCSSSSLCFSHPTPCLPIWQQFLFFLYCRISILCFCVYPFSAFLLEQKSTKGMTSFDALEAIQTDSAEVTLRVASADLQPRDVSLRRAYTTKNPVKYKLVNTFFFGEWAHFSHVSNPAFCHLARFNSPKMEKNR